MSQNTFDALRVEDLIGRRNDNDTPYISEMHLEDP